MGGKLQDGASTIGTGRNGADIFGVLNSNNNTGSQKHLFPCLVQVDDMDTISSAFVGVLGHLRVDVFGAEVDTSNEELSDILKKIQ